MLLSDDPRTMAMLAMGTSLLQAGGPSTQRTSFGSALGQGLQSGMSSFLATQKAAEDKKLRDMQVKVAQGQVDDSTRKTAFFNKIAQLQNPGGVPTQGQPQMPGVMPASINGAPPPGLLDDGNPKPRPGLNILDMISADPSLSAAAMEYLPGFSAAAMKQGEDRTKVVGDNLVDTVTGKPIFTAAAKPPPPSDDQKEYADAKKEGYKGTLQDWIIDQRKASAARTEVRMPPMESAYDTNMGKYMADKFAAMQESGMKATGGIARMDRLDQLLDQVNTGAFAGTAVEIKKAAKAAGLDLDAVGVKDDVAPAEAAKALANEMALELRNPAGGAGMPGAMSDGDRRMLESMGPNLTQTAEGRKMLIDARKRLYKREQDVAKMARDYEKRNKRLDSGFFDELAQWSEKNPMFSNEDMSKAEAARLPKLTSPAEAAKLPSGTRFTDPNGVIRVVP